MRFVYPAIRVRERERERERERVFTIHLTGQNGRTVCSASMMEQTWGTFSAKSAIADSKFGCLRVCVCVCTCVHARVYVCVSA